MNKQQTIKKATKLLDNVTEKYYNEVMDELALAGVPMVFELTDYNSMKKTYWELVIKLIEDKDATAPVYRHLTLEEKRVIYG